MDVEGTYYLKKGQPSSDTQYDETYVDKRVEDMLLRIQKGGESEIKRLAFELDNYDGDIVMTPEIVEEIISTAVPQKEKDAIKFSYQRIKAFAEAQRDGLKDTDMEISPGYRVGSRYIPVSCAGCYVPGGRYAHIASALMGPTTARGAGVPHVVAATPPRVDFALKNGVVIKIPHPSVLYALRLAGVDKILCIGGVQAIAAMSYGLYSGERSIRCDVICGPGNRFVTAAKKYLFSKGVGIDLIAGPTETAIIADDSVSAETVAIDLVSQLEHGPDSAAALITTSESLGEEVLKRVPEISRSVLPEPNQSAALLAWKNFGEIIICSSKEAMVQASDYIASEHLQVMCQDLAYYKKSLKNYGSLFLGENVCVTLGDKSSGPNHVLPTKKASRYTGGLYVGTFLKCLSWQTATKDGAKKVAFAAAVISRAEGMEGHALSSDLRNRLHIGKL